MTWCSKEADGANTDKKVVRCQKNVWGLAIDRQAELSDKRRGMLLEPGPCI